MHYDLELLHEFCQELGFPSSISSNEKLEIKFSEHCVLVFWNYKSDGSEAECIMGFKIEGFDESFNSHIHGNIVFSNGINYVEMNPLDILAGLKDGTVLICEVWRKGELDDRTLMHHKIDSTFEKMDKDEEIRVFRVNI
jgi:hypothetical protein